MRNRSRIRPRAGYWSVFLGLAFLWGAIGCDDDGGTRPDPIQRFDSPEAVLDNLQSAYLQRDPDLYGQLLAPEFTFWFQPQDARDLGADFWMRDQDSTQTAALFLEPHVTRIDINLTYQPAEPDTQAGRPPGAMHIRVQPTYLEVDEVNNGITTTWPVHGDIQDFCFRPGLAGAGEDTTHWYLFEWRDVPGASPGDGIAVARATWGHIKRLYQPTPVLSSGGGPAIVPR